MSAVAPPDLFTVVKCPECGHMVRFAAGKYFAHDVDGLEPNGPGYFSGQNPEGVGHRRCWPDVKHGGERPGAGRPRENPDAPLSERLSTALTPADYQRVLAFAQAEGVTPGAALRRLALRALAVADHLSPVEKDVLWGL